MQKKLDLLANTTVVDYAIRFVSMNSASSNISNKEQFNFEETKIRDSKEADKRYNK